MSKPTSRINVTKPSLPPRELFDSYVDSIWANNWLTNNGPLHNLFEQQLMSQLQVPNVSLFTNGHLALEAAIRVSGLSGEVITTPFTFASTLHAMTNCGLTPVFCDIEPNTYCIDVAKIEALISERTSAIIPVHVFGYPCDVRALEAVAMRNGLKVIYDAAHAFGVEIGGVGIGDFGDISMFSLHATKVFHAIEGGVLSFADETLKTKFNQWKNFGIAGEESIEMAGTNAKMNEFQAAMGLSNLTVFAEHVEKRRIITEVYRERLRHVAGIRVMDDLDGVKHNYAYFPILVDEREFGCSRNELHEQLKTFNIFARKYFYPLCTDFECYDFSSDMVPVARSIAASVLTLPIYADLSPDEVNCICDAIETIRTVK